MKPWMLGVVAATQVACSHKVALYCDVDTPCGDLA